jgi:hypothetical protein
LTKRIDAAYKRREEYVERRVTEIVDGCIKALGKNKNGPDDRHRVYHLKHEVALELGARFAPLFGKELDGHCLINQLVDGFVNAVTCPSIQSMLDFLWLEQKGNEASYGDIDLTFIKYLDNKDVRVSTLRDHCSCWEINKFIFIEDKEAGTIHIRYYYDLKDSDYKKPDAYPKRLWFKFFEDHNFKMDGSDGAGYGDLRDDCYILSFDRTPTRYSWKKIHTDRCLTFYEKIQAVEFKLHVMVDEIKSELPVK